MAQVGAKQTGTEIAERSPRDLMITVGRQVRIQRTRRGLTRRALSRQTEISERYLGEVEKGRANITLNVLQRIAATLNEPISTFLMLGGQDPRISPPLAELLARMNPVQQAELYRGLLRERQQPKEGQRGVALVGLRGAGKSTLGELLAEAHGITFLRVSDVIQDLAGMAIGELLELMGYNAYRRFERRALARIIDAYPCAVVEAGGSLVQDTEAYNQLMRNYLTVWVRASPQDHMQRVLDQGDTRPMAGNAQAMDELRLILREREPYYTQADAALDTSGKTIEESFQDLARICRPALQHARR